MTGVQTCALPIFIKKVDEVNFLNNEVHELNEKIEVLDEDVASKERSIARLDAEFLTKKESLAKDCEAIREKANREAKAALDKALEEVASIKEEARRADEVRKANVEAAAEEERKLKAIEKKVKAAKANFLKAFGE